MILKIFRKFFGKTTKTGLDNFIDSLASEIKNFRTVFDVGAYQGNFISEILKINPSINVHAFEPFAASCTLLNTKFAHISNVVLNHAAVSDTAGKALLNVNAFKETNSLLASSEVNENIDLLTKYQTTESVEVLQLDEYCSDLALNEIDLVKIDTQGNSYQVLKGMEVLLKAKKVKYLYVEAEFVEIYKNEKLFSEIELLMRGYGYSICNLYNLNYVDKQKLGWCDILFSPTN